LSGGFIRSEKALYKEEIFQRIRQDISSNDVVLYMKGTSAFPKCGYSAALIDILDSLGLEYKSVDLLEDEALSKGLKKFTECPSTPQLYVKGQFLGECDKVRHMYFSGELQNMLREKKLIV